MIQRIKKNRMLKPYLYEKLEDEGIEVEIEKSLNAEDYAAVKVDEYYMGQHDKTPPKAADFVVAVDCECDSYALYVLEFKNVGSPKALVIRDIQDKFSTTVYDFLSGRFADIFLNSRYKYKAVKLYLVSDAYKTAGAYRNHEEYRRIMERVNKRDSLKVDMALGSKLYRFRNRILKIEYEIPPNPVIKKLT